MSHLYTGLASIAFGIVLFIGVRWAWFCYKSRSYAKSVMISDAWLFGACGSIFPFFDAFLPLLEQLCLTAGQQRALQPFFVVPAMVASLAALGIMFENLETRKISASVLVFALLVIGGLRVVIGNEPCQRADTDIVVTAPDIEILRLLGWLATAVMVTAAVLTIWEFIARRRQKRKDRPHSED